MGLSGTKVKRIYSGDQHSFAIDHKNQVYSWGAGELGQNGLGRPEDQMVPEMIKFD